MFTGIIEDIGVIKKITGKRITVETKLDEIKIGDSVAVDGVCLTVCAIASSGSMLEFDVSEETFERSNLRQLKTADKVNLERAIRADGRFGGHFVTGHVDECGKIVGLSPKNNSVVMKIKGNTNYIIEKGSVAVNGVSLTIAELDEAEGFFAVALIPHTLKSTTLRYAYAGEIVNIEYDVFAKYALKRSQKNASKKITPEKLKDEGFF